MAASAALVAVVGMVAGCSATVPGAGRPPATSSSPTSPVPSPARATTTVTVSPTAPSDFAQLFSQVRSGVVRIQTVACGESGIGTGFLVAPDLVATVDHVVASPVTVSLSTDGDQAAGTVIGVDPSNDLALVRASHPLAGNLFHLAAADPPVGTRVAAIGFPIGDPITVTQGGISGVNRAIDVDGQHRVGLIETDTPVNPGNSGGPLIAEDGTVTGLVDALNTQANGIAYAVPAHLAADDIRNWTANPDPQAPASCDDPTEPTPGQAEPLPTPQNPDLDGTDSAALMTALSTYFNGINTGDYAAAWAVLGPRLQAGSSLTAFADGLTSSIDSAFTILGVTVVDADHVTVGVGFTSTQTPDKGPNGDTCDRWTLDYQMLRNGPNWLINQTTSRNGRSHTSC